MHATEAGAKEETSAWLHPGVADGIEQHGDVDLARRASRSSWFGSPERTEYGRETLSGNLTKGSWLGMRAGIARKSGNAGGVKALTVIGREGTNICYTQR